jgi:curli biogenesis system outer membrane secretion channel CsgG
LTNPFNKRIIKPIRRAAMIKEEISMKIRQLNVPETLIRLCICVALVVTIGLSESWATDPVLGGSKTTATGAAGGATPEGASNQLERCAESLGTTTVVEDQGAAWYGYMYQQYKLGSTVPLLRMMIQQSNCFVVVERGRAMGNVMQERALDSSGELRQGSSFQKGQMVAADYTMSPSINFSQKGTSGVGGGLGGLLGSAGRVFGAIAGGLKSNEASTTLLLIDNRSGVQLAAAEGSAQNWDFNLAGGLLGSTAGGGLGGYTNTPEGKILTAAFMDSYNKLVWAVRNYRAQTVEGGLGTGGRLGVQGGQTPASQGIGR